MDARQLGVAERDTAALLPHPRRSRRRRYFLAALMVGLVVVGAVLLAVFMQPVEEGSHLDLVLVGAQAKDGAPITCLSLNSSTGAMTTCGLNAVCNSPSFLVWNRALTVVYVAGEESPERVTSFAMEKSPFSMIDINVQYDPGNQPCHIALHPSETWLLTASYNSGNVSVFPVNSTGFIESRRHVVYSGAKAHQVVFSTDGQFAFVPCLGADYIAFYVFNQTSGELIPNTPPTVSLPPLSGPRHMILHPSLPFAFVLTESSNEIVTLDYDMVRGVLAHPRAVSALPPNTTTEQFAAEIALSPNKRFLYVSHRSFEPEGLNAVCVFSLNATTMEPTLVECETGGGDVSVPRHFSIHPSGKWLLVANQDTDTVTSFSVDPNSGRMNKVFTTPGPDEAAFVGIIV